jgi:periplasmic copper chaperone A
MLSSHSLRAAVAVSLLLLGACEGRQREPKVENAWVRMPAVKGEPGAAYFRLEGNIEGTRLTSVTSPLIRRIELHETVEKNGVTRMEKRKEIDFPYRGALEFEPGGRHAMLFGVNKAVKPGGTVPLTFSFNTAPPVTVDAQVRDASGEGHGGH